MALTESYMMELGSVLPNFNLIDVISNKKYSNEDLKQSKAILLMFICNHCPFVKHVWHEFSRLEQDYAQKGVSIVAVNSNDIEHYPQDGPEHMKMLHQDMKWSFPFLLDDQQSFAKSLKAACTPDFYIFNQSHELFYRGQLDDSRPGNSIEVSGKDIRLALDRALANEAPLEQQKPSIGCNIKWKPGNEPEFF